MFHWLAFLLKKSKHSIFITNVKVKEKKVHGQFEELKDRVILVKCLCLGEKKVDAIVLP